jgi:hypothetical protein
MLFESTLTRAALLATVNHRPNGYEVACVELRDTSSDKANFANNLVSGDTWKHCSVGINCAVPVVEQYAKFPNTSIYGLSRRIQKREGASSHIAVDLNDASDVAAKLSVTPRATHLVFGAYADKSTPLEKSDANISILRNLLDYVKASQPELRHITCIREAKRTGRISGSTRRQLVKTILV